VWYECCAIEGLPKLVIFNFGDNNMVGCIELKSTEGKTVGKEKDRKTHIKMDG
jgi:hypothetical protein